MAERISYDGRYPILNHKYLHYGVRTVGAPYTAVTDGAECVLLVNAATTITLPLATVGKYAVYVKNIFNGVVTIARTGGNTIEGVGANITLPAQYDGVLLVSDGVNGWWILADV